MHCPRTHAGSERAVLQTELTMTWLQSWLNGWIYMHNFGRNESEIEVISCSGIVDLNSDFPRMVISSSVDVARLGKLGGVRWSKTWSKIRPVRLHRSQKEGVAQKKNYDCISCPCLFKKNCTRITRRRRRRGKEMQFRTDLVLTWLSWRENKATRQSSAILAVDERNHLSFEMELCAIRIAGRRNERGLRLLWVLAYLIHLSGSRLNSIRAAQTITHISRQGQTAAHRRVELWASSFIFPFWNANPKCWPQT